MFTITTYPTALINDNSSYETIEQAAHAVFTAIALSSVRTLNNRAFMLIQCELASALNDNLSSVTFTTDSGCTVMCKLSGNPFTLHFFEGRERQIRDVQLTRAIEIVYNILTKYGTTPAYPTALKAIIYNEIEFSREVARNEENGDGEAVAWFELTNGLKIYVCSHVNSANKRYDVEFAWTGYADCYSIQQCLDIMKDFSDFNDRAFLIDDNMIKEILCKEERGFDFATTGYASISCRFGRELERRLEVLTHAYETEFLYHDEKCALALPLVNCGWADEYVEHFGAVKRNILKVKWVNGATPLDKKDRYVIEIKSEICPSPIELNVSMTLSKVQELAAKLLFAIQFSSKKTWDVCYILDKDENAIASTKNN